MTNRLIESGPSRLPIQQEQKWSDASNLITSVAKLRIAQVSTSSPQAIRIATHG